MTMSMGSPILHLKSTTKKTLWLKITNLQYCIGVQYRIQKFRKGADWSKGSTPAISGVFIYLFEQQAPLECGAITLNFFFDHDIYLHYGQNCFIKSCRSNFDATIYPTHTTFECIVIPDTHLSVSTL